MKAYDRLALAALLVATLASNTAHTQQPVEVHGQHATIKLSQTVFGYLAELNGKYQLRVTGETFNPGASVGPHHHAGPGIRCITVGEFTYIAAGKTTIYRPGDCFYEAGNMAHEARNTTEKLVVLLNFEILPASVSGGSLMPVPTPK